MSANSLPELDRFRPRLRLLAEIELSSRIRVKEDASDIVQQTLLQAHRDLTAYRGQTDAELFAWLKAILAHNVLNAARFYRTQKRNSRREQSIADRLEQSSMRIEEFLACEHSSPSQRAVANEMLERLAHGLEQLRESERTAIVLKHFQSWTVAQISEHLGRPPDAIAGLLKRGLKKLRTHLQTDAE